MDANIIASRLGGSIPLTIDFDATQSCGPVDIVTYEWNFDGTIQEGALTTNTWLGSGTSTVTLTAIDANGEISTTSLDISITAANCPIVEQTLESGSLEHEQLTEASGLMVSNTISDLMWSHNDSGDSARIFAMGLDGRNRGVFSLDGAEHSDWEDATRYTDPQTGITTLFLGDIGDNNNSRASITVIMLTEPDASMLDIADDTTLSDWSLLSLNYPDDAAYNADTLMADPQTGDLFIVAEDEANNLMRIFRKPAPHVADEEATLEEITTLEMEYPTGGEFSPLGDRIVLRTADTGHLWLRDASTDLLDTFDQAACPIPIAEEVRGEAIAFSATGDGYYTTSEEAHQPVWLTTFQQEEPCDGLEARILRTPEIDEVPVQIAFSADELCIPAGLAATEWVIDGEQTTDLNPSQLFNQSGEFSISLTVTDNNGETASTQTTLSLDPQSCPEIGETQTWGTVESTDIDEASGVVVSDVNDGVIWVHNDSGDSARLFAMATDGTHLGVFALDANANDWEDLTAGWNEEWQDNALYIGDVGDNPGSRDSISVLIVPEPEINLNQAPEEETIFEFSEMTLTYPDDESHNCESLAWDPLTGDLIIVTKSADGQSHVFSKPAPHIDGTDTELTWLHTLSFGEDPLSGSAYTTGSAFSPLGDKLIIRTYSDAWIWVRDGQEALETVFDNEACDAHSPSESQGEAIAFTPDGAGYVTISEGDESPILYTPLAPE